MAGTTSASCTRNRCACRSSSAIRARSRPARAAPRSSLNVDFAPTFLDLAGVTPPRPMQGRCCARSCEGRRRPTGGRACTTATGCTLDSSHSRAGPTAASAPSATSSIHYYERADSTSPARRDEPHPDRVGAVRPRGRPVRAAQPLRRPDPCRRARRADAPSWIASPTRSGTSRPTLIHGLAGRDVVTDTDEAPGPTGKPHRAPQRRRGRPGPATAGRARGLTRQRGTRSGDARLGTGRPAPPATSSSAPPRPTGPGSCWRSVSRRCVRSPIRPSPTAPARRSPGVLPGRGGGIGQGLRPAALRASAPRRSTDGEAQVTIDGRRRPGRPAAVQRPWRPMIGAEHSQPARGHETRPAAGRSAPSSGGAAAGTRRARRRGRARPRHPRRRPRHLPRGGRPCRSTTSAASTGSTTTSSASACGRSSSSASCRATSPRDPSKTVFDYGAIVSPPKDWDRWEALVRELTGAPVDRYGLDEVRRWGFEVWNEANLDVFWSGTREEYLRLYDLTCAP